MHKVIVILIAVLFCVPIGLLVSNDVSATDTSVTLNATADTWLDYQNQTLNHGSTTYLYSRTGYDNILVKFDLNGVTTNMTTATLKLWVNNCTSVNQIANVSVITDTWVETAVTYDNKPLWTGYQHTTFVGAPSMIGTYFSIDLTAITKNCVINGTANYGVIIKMVGTTDTIVQFSAREGAHSPQLVIAYGSNVNPPTGITVIPATSNPVFPNHNSEPTLIPDGSGGMDNWFSAGASIGDGTYANIWYTHASNAGFTDWSTPVKAIDNVRFGSVVKDSSTYYYFGCKYPLYPNGDIFMWTSTDKTNWSIGNGGNAVLHHSTDPNSQWYSIWNVGVININHQFFLWAECATSAGTLNQNGVRLGYTYSPVSGINFDTHKTENAVVMGGGNPCAIYVPDRNGIILMYGLLTTGVWQIRSSVINFANDLNNPSSYWGTYNFALGPSNEQTADPAIAFVATGHTYPILVQWFHNQPVSSDLYQGYIDMSLDELYDAMSNGTIAQTITTPYGLVAISGDSNAQIGWDTVASAIGYHLYRSTDDTNYTLISSPNLNRYVDSAVSIGRTYYYKVSAYNTNESALSSAVSVTITHPVSYGNVDLGLGFVILGCGCLFIGVMFKWLNGKKA